ncbi:MULTISPECIES: GNAT family N-acetyltransferase [Gracilibacillus]|uniref:GNAT family N-acetyltransferase n=1 Tax=Gracilibacillus TaxID=74385 RepID=UPI000824CCEE|nr:MULTISPECIES: GNAT family N-acetyltransferase [Gracilibacillus]
MYHVKINSDISKSEVPDLRESVGWDRHDQLYPELLDHIYFWGAVRDHQGKLIAFGYVSSPGNLHGYMEDIIVHPDYQRKGIGVKLVRRLLEEANLRKLDHVSATFQEKHQAFYKRCGLKPCSAGIWKR